MQATIEIDDKLIPQDYECIAFRAPEVGETYLLSSPGVKQAIMCHEKLGSWISTPMILRRKWQWPSWLTCRSIARRGDGVWVYFRSSIPVDEIRDGLLWWVDTDGVCGIPLPSAAIDLSVLPECDPADSLRINPNWNE